MFSATRMNLGIFLLLAFGAKVKCFNDFGTMTMTMTPTPCPTPTPTTTPCPTITSTSTSEAATCVIPLPTTTLACKGRHEACKQCADNQTCVQVGKSDDGVYGCPTFECKDCPEPVCDPPCGCKEECVIVNTAGGSSCPIAKCKALPVCMTCPPVSCDALQCEENFECKIKPGSCDSCPRATCEAKPCLECPSEPITCMCPRGKECKIIHGSCYKCPVVDCVEVPDPCAGCKGECAVSPNPNCENCPPKRLCVEECRECSPFLPSWKCSDPRNALYVPRTCSSCSEYRCLNECKDCSKHQAKCDCENPDDCVLQPRSCDQCATFYCKNGN